MSSEKPAHPARHARLLVAALGFLVALAGQFAFYLTPEGGVNGIVLGMLLSLLGAGMVLFGPRNGLPAWAARIAGRFSLSISAVRVLGAILLTVATVITELLFINYGRTNYLPVLLLWLASALTYGAAFIERAPGWPAVRAWLSTHRQELLMLALVTALAAGLRLFQLGAIPRVIDGDEGQVGVAALSTRDAPLANPFALWANFGGLYLQVIALSLNTLGVTPFALRLVPAVLGTLAVPAVYLLSRSLFGARVGLVAAILLALSHAHLHFSRIVSVAYIAETFLVPLELYFFYTGLRNRQAWRAAAGGLILGAHFSVYVSAQIVSALLLVYLLIAGLVARPLVRGASRTVLAFWLGVLITGAGQVVWSFRHPGEFVARLNADGTFQSGWLEREVASSGQGAVQILAGRVTHAFLTLSHLPAIDFYGARIPLLDLLTGVLFVFGLVYTLWRTRDSRYLLLNGYFWALLIAIAIFSIPPTADSYRMLVTLPAAIVCAAVGLERVLVVLAIDRPEHRGARLSISGCLLASVLLLNWRAYFVDFAARCRYGGDRATRFASYLGNYLKTVSSETVVYLLSDDELQYGTHPSVNFLSGGTPVTNWMEPVAGLAVNTNTVVLAGPPRHAELRDWARGQPTGAVSLVTDCEQPMLLVYSPADR